MPSRGEAEREAQGATDSIVERTEGIIGWGRQEGRGKRGPDPGSREWGGRGTHFPAKVAGGFKVHGGGQRFSKASV